MACSCNDNYEGENIFLPQVAEIVSANIKQHYYGSHKTINPTGIVPLGQEIDFFDIFQVSIQNDLWSKPLKQV